jgi:hypothetical protein
MNHDASTGWKGPGSILKAGPGAAVRVVGPVTHIDLPTPPMGGKCWVLKSKGLFVLERGPGVLRTIACTHAGAGALEAIDGIPDENGFFPDQDMPEPNVADFLHTFAYDGAGVATPMPGGYDVAAKAYACRQGRPLYSASPTVMGSWMLDAGFLHGLTIRAAGGHEAAFVIASIVWMPVPQRVLDDIALRKKQAKVLSPGES